MQKTVIEAMQNASRQVTTAIDEMRQRMTELQQETRQAMGTASGSVADQSDAGEEDIRSGPELRGDGASAEIFSGQELAD